MQRRFGVLAWTVFIAAAGSNTMARAQSDAVAPQVTVDTPRNGGVFLAPQLAGGLVGGRARDNIRGSGLATVTLLLWRGTGAATRYYDGRGFNLLTGRYLAATLKGSGELKAWSFRLPTVAQGLTPGLYHIRALARDRKNNNGFSPLVSFTIRGTAASGDVTPPHVSIDTPSNGGVYSASLTHFGALGSAHDNVGGGGIASISIIAYRYADTQGPAGYFNGTTFSSSTPIENPAIVPPTVSNQETQWLFDKPTVFTPGRILLTAVARDRAGNRSQTSITFTRR